MWRPNLGENLASGAAAAGKGQAGLRGLCLRRHGCSPNPPDSAPMAHSPGSQLPGHVPAEVCAETCKLQTGALSAVWFSQGAEASELVAPLPPGGDTPAF